MNGLPYSYLKNMLKQPYNRPNTLVNITRVPIGAVVFITLQEAKDYMRVDYDTDDTLIQSIITASYDMFESYTGRVLAPATVTLYYGSYGSTIHLPIAPIVTIDSVEYRQNNGDWVDVTGDWELFGSTIQVIYPNYVADGTRLKVELTGGYGTIPEAIKIGLLKWITSNYEDRQDNISGTIVAKMPNESKMLWKPYKIMIL